MRKRVLTAVFLLLMSASAARADWLLTPYLGVTFGGDTPKEQVNYGLSAAFLGSGIFGVEFDAAITPNFLDTGNNSDINDSNVSTLMANFMLSAPHHTPGGLRPYASAGAGIIRIKATSVGNFFDISDSNFGVNAGAGVLGQFSDHVGVRGDIRYFRSVQDSAAGDDINLDFARFNFWRGTLGVTFRF
ncbi:MAG: outer membrane beta-barrel protein [Acidobacteriota bacterium]